MSKTDAKSRVVTTYCLASNFVSGTCLDVAAVLEHIGIDSHRDSDLQVVLSRL